MSTTTAQNGSRAAGSHDGIFYVYIEQCSSVQTAKTEKICEKTHTPHMHMSKLHVCTTKQTFALCGRPDQNDARACAVQCMRFLAYFLRFLCLNTTTLFNIDVKNTLLCRRCQLLCCYSAPLLWPIYLHATLVPGISVCIFSCNCIV